MNKENKHNDLDKFFKSRLSDEKRASNAWNVPSDDVLNGAFGTLDQLDKEEKKERSGLGFLFLGLAALIFITLTSLIFVKSNEVDQLNQKITSLNESIESNQKENESSIEDIKSILASAELDPVENENENQNQKGNQSVKTNQFQSLNENRTSFGANQNLKGNSATTTAPILNKIVIANPPSNSNFYSAKASNKSLVFPITKKDRSEKQLMLLSKEGLIGLLDQANRNALALNVLILDEKKNQVENKWSAYVAAGHLYSTLKMNALANPNYSLEDYDSYYHGWQVSGGVDYQLSQRTALGFGLGLNKTYNHSLYKSMATYDSNNEFINQDGDVMYNSQMSIETPLGRFAEEMNMDVSNLNLSDGDQMENKTHISQHVKFASASLYLKHALIKTERYELALSSGLSLNRLISCNQELDVHLYNGTEEMGNHKFEYNQNDQLKSFFTTAQLGLNLTRSFKNNVFIQFGANYNRSIDSITKDVASNGTKTYLQSFNSSLALGYRF